MNCKLSITFLLLFIAPLFIGCGGSVKEKNKNNKPADPLSLHEGDEQYVTIDTKQSVVTWKGANSFGPHTGFVYLSKGELKLENDQLTGGSVEVDMNTIEDDNHKRSNGLIDHLKNEDFFDVKKYPFTTIVITGVTTINGEEKAITGNLTIKEVTHPVTFPAKIEVKEGIVKATGTLVIDRTKWGVRYNSGKFYDFLANETIADEIEFNITVVSKK